MTVASAGLTDAGVGVVLADNPASLSILTNPCCPGVIWRREMPAHVRTWLDRLDPEHLPVGRLVLAQDGVAKAVSHLCDTAGMPTCPERDWLEADITRMAEVFADLMSADYLRLRLAAVTNNACRKFHVDALTARLVCTYRGSGTQYGYPRDGGDPPCVFQVATGAPILLRGTLWPEDPPSGLRHRSPPIEGTGETRLVLVLDPVFDLEEEM